MKPKNIDIIVPVYNTNNTLKRCVESLLNQNFNFFNIILIDDGSTDGSSSICDYYSSFKNIIVYHIKNGGIANARNFGLKVSMSKYIMFVDSDDWVSDNFLKEAFDFMQSTQNDIGIFGYYYSLGNKQINKAHYSYYKRIHIRLSKEEAIKGLLDDTIGNYAWNKIYKRKVITGIEYPVGKDFEDLATMYKIFENADHIGVLNKYLYYYFQREDSIMHSLSVRSIGDALEARISLQNYVKDNFPSLTELSHRKLLFNALQYVVYSYREESYGKLFIKASQILKGSRRQADSLNWKSRLMIFLFQHNQYLFKLIAKRTGKN